MFVCFFVWLFSINVKTAEQIGSKFCVGPHVTPGKVYGWWKFQNLGSIRFWFSINFEITRIFFQIRELYCFYCFTVYTKRKCSQLKLKMGAKRPEFLVYIELICGSCFCAPWLSIFCLQSLIGMQQIQLMQNSSWQTKSILDMDIYNNMYL